MAKRGRKPKQQYSISTIAAPPGVSAGPRADDMRRQVNGMATGMLATIDRNIGELQREMATLVQLFQNLKAIQQATDEPKEPQE